MAIDFEERVLAVLQSIDKRLENLEIQMVHTMANTDTLLERMDSAESFLGVVECRLDSMDGHMESMEGRSPEATTERHHQETQLALQKVDERLFSIEDILKENLMDIAKLKSKTGVR